MRLDPPAARARARDADASRRHPGRRGADRRARAEARPRASAHAHHHGLPVADLAGPARRSQSARLSLSLVDARDLPRQDRRDQGCSAKIRRQWFAKRKSIMAILKEVMTNEASVADGHRRRQQGARRRCGAAGARLRSRRPGLCHRDRHGLGRGSRASPTRRLRLVEKTIQGRDFTCMRETVNAIEAWLGSLPGHVYANVRQPPVSTLNLAHMMPFSAVWAGPERDEHLRRRRRCSSRGRRARRRSGFRSMSAMSATRWSSVRPAPARACCWR